VPLLLRWGPLLRWKRCRHVDLGCGHLGNLVNWSPAVRAEPVVWDQFLPAVPTISVRHVTFLAAHNALWSRLWHVGPRHIISSWYLGGVMPMLHANFVDLGSCQAENGGDVERPNDDQHGQRQQADCCNGVQTQAASTTAKMSRRPACGQRNNHHT